MSCSILPVASEVSGIKDILEPFPELLLNPGNKNDLAKKLEKLINQMTAKAILQKTYFKKV